MRCWELTIVGTGEAEPSQRGPSQRGNGLLRGKELAPGSMAGNWVVRSYADQVFESIDDLSSWLMAGLQQSGSVESPCLIRSMDNSDANTTLDSFVTDSVQSR
jgi:hypothetical protein